MRYYAIWAGDKSKIVSVETDAQLADAVIEAKADFSCSYVNIRVSQLSKILKPEFQLIETQIEAQELALPTQLPKDTRGNIGTGIPVNQRI